MAKVILPSMSGKTKDEDVVDVPEQGKDPLRVPSNLHLIFFISENYWRNIYVYSLLALFSASANNFSLSQ